jgi:Bifunctional DNA primase/polymerase, N-terminal/Family of unknown function (DUF5906)
MNAPTQTRTRGAAVNPGCEHALAMAREGGRVFPLNGKKPAVVNPKEAATRDEDTIRAWGEVHTNFGVLTGRDSGSLVADLDDKPARGKEGPRHWEDLRTELELDGFRTRTVRTGSGGTHVYVGYPAGSRERIRGGANFAGLEGLDLVADDGSPWYVVQPGSIHPETGLPYETVDEGPIAEAPPALWAWILDHQRPVQPHELADDPPSPADDGRRPDAKLIAAHCPAARRWRDDPASVGYDEWLAMQSVVVRCEGGEALVHKWSKGHPEYDRLETDRKVREARKLKPFRCGTIAAPECARCPFNGTIRSPISLGYGNPDLLRLQAVHVLDTQTHAYVDVTTGASMTDKTFNDMFAHRVKKGRPHGAFVQDVRSPKAACTDFRPDRAELMFRERNDLVVNAYRPGGVAESQGDCPTILNHLEYLIPDEKERAHLLDMFAHALQRPGEKVKHAAILTGPKGNGKSWLVEDLTRLLVGPDNVTVWQGDSLKHDYLYGMGNCQVLVIDELMQSGRLEVANKLKPWITQDRVRAQEKHQPFAPVRTPYLVLATSNFDVPIYARDDDRRWFIVRTTSERRPASYYVDLFGNGLAEAAAFKGWLLRRDLSGFNAGGKAPMTAGKLELIEGSRTPLADEIARMTDEGTALRPVMTLSGIVTALVHRDVVARGKVGDRQVIDALRAVGWKRREGQVWIDGKAQRLWLHPTVAGALGTATADEIRARYHKPPAIVALAA